MRRVRFAASRSFQPCVGGIALGTKYEHKTVIKRLNCDITASPCWSLSVCFRGSSACVLKAERRRCCRRFFYNGVELEWTIASRRQPPLWRLCVVASSCCCIFAIAVAACRGAGRILVEKAPQCSYFAEGALFVGTAIAGIRIS